MTQRPNAKSNAFLRTALGQYLVITGNYWCFTLTDGALRMLIVLHFHALGYSPINIALLFLFYEFFGVITNLVGGWLGAKIGLNHTMNLGLGLQVLALGMLLLPPEWLTVIWVMVAQALSGIAKDLNKMSAKSAIKTLIPAQHNGRLFRWVALLTGSKNALKGAGFFLGVALLQCVGFTFAIAIMAAALVLVWIMSMVLLNRDIGKIKQKITFTHLFAKSRAINILAAARLFLFAARDIWFVIALPVYLSQQLGWSPLAVGTFFALWVIGYGVMQALTPFVTATNNDRTPRSNPFIWALLLALIPVAISFWGEAPTGLTLTIGLGVFGIVFAVNSAIHSYLIVAHANREGASLDVGFYYMANALGRLLGTLLSGLIFQQFGLQSCLWVSAGLLVASAICIRGLQPH